MLLLNYSEKYNRIHLHCFFSSSQTCEKERLLQEQSELEQNLEETRQSLCGLCKSVSNECGSNQHHLQLLAKLSSPEPTVSSTSPLSKGEESQITIKMVSCSSEDDQNKTDAPEPETPTGESASQESFPDPVSLLKDCLAMNNIL